MPSFLIQINEFLTFAAVFPAVVLLGFYLTIKLRFVQISKLGMSLSFLFKKDKGTQGNISHYEAVASVLAGNFGTGNISGMAVAITTGGPGALVWMWLMAFLGSSIQYGSCLLGVKYRKINERGEFIGGPMHYLQEGLGYKKLAKAFAFFTIAAGIVVGNLVQVNSVVLPLERAGLNPFVCGVILAFCVGIVLLGGLKRMAQVASFIVPIKAILYFGTALIILFLNSEKVLPALQLMIVSAVNPQSALGGVTGFGVARAISSGFDRGLFATDAGTGLAPILQSSARTTDPVIDGIVTLAAPFLVMIVCTMTGLVLIVTGVWRDSTLQSTNMVTEAFQQGIGHPIGAVVVISALLLFAYTTIFTWAFCAERACSFLLGTRNTNFFKYVFIALIPLGTLLHVELIWRLADISISCMLLINLIAVAKLSSEVIEDSRRYFAEELQLCVVEKK